MSSYLLGRKQRVCLHGVCSTYSELGAGLPQGSLLEPPFFNIFINDWNYAVPGVSLTLYANDTTLYASDVSPIALQVAVSQGLSRLSQPSAKTQALPIGPCKYDFHLTLNDSAVTKLPPIRILGVELDSMLNFIEHIASQLIKACATTGALRRIRRFVDVMPNIHPTDYGRYASIQVFHFTTSRIL